MPHLLETLFPETKLVQLQIRLRRESSRQLQIRPKLIVGILKALISSQRLNVVWGKHCSTDPKASLEFLVLLE